MTDIHYAPAGPREPLCKALAGGELHGTPDPAKVTCIACRAPLLAADSPQGRQS